MASSVNVFEIARRFADALDHEDYAAARALIAADCRYQGPTAIVLGPDAIISSYRDNGASARRLFDAVEYRSEVVKIDDQTAIISFFDHLSKEGRAHVYECRQRLTIGSDGLLASIRHEELPGRRERLLEFCASVGITLPEAENADGV